MKVRTLHKLLTNMIYAGHGHKPVVINKSTFKHPLESDGVVMLDVRGAEVSVITIADGDGFTIENKDGSERGKIVVMLFGDEKE